MSGQSGHSFPLTPPIEVTKPPDGGTSGACNAQDWEEEWDVDDMDFFNDAEMIDDLEKIKSGAVKEKDKLVRLECTGKPEPLSKLFASDSILPRGCLAALLKNKNITPWLESQSSACSAFAFQLPCTVDCLWNDSRHFFSAVKQSVRFIENQCSSNHFSATEIIINDSDSTNSPSALHEQIAIFYNSLWHYVQYTLCSKSDTPCGQDSNLIEYKSVRLKQKCSVIAKEVLSVLKFIGPFHSLQNHVTSAVSPQSNKCPSVAYHLFHAHLTIRWWSLAILHSIESTHDTLNVPLSTKRNSLPILVKEEGIATQPMMGQDLISTNHWEPFGQIIALILWDTFLLLSRQLKSENHTSEVTLPCSCCEELCLSLLHVIKERNLSSKGQSVWSIVRPRLTSLLKPRENDRSYPKGEVSSPNEVISMVLCLVRLGILDAVGGTLDQQSDPLLPPEAGLIKELLLRLFSAPHLPEETLRCVMSSCLSLSLLWDKEARVRDWALIAWEKHYSKNLDGFFLLSRETNSLQGMACVSNDISAWVKLTTTAPEHSKDIFTSSAQNSSWILFLRLFGSVLQRGGSKAWLGVKGRILTKFTDKRVSDLSAMGIYNTALLLLTCASGTAGEATSESCELLTKVLLLQSPNALCATPSQASRATMALKGLVALCQVTCQIGINVSAVSPGVRKVTSLLCQTYGSTKDVMQKREVCRVISSFVSSFGSLCSSVSDFSLGQHTLLSPSLCQVMKVCSVSELQQVCLGLHTLLRSVITNAMPGGRLDIVSVSGHQLVATIDQVVSGVVRARATSPSDSIVPTTGSLLTVCHAILSQSHSTVTLLPQSDESNAYQCEHRECTHSALTYYLTNQMVHPQFALQFLHGVLVHQDTLSIEEIPQVTSDFSEQLVSRYLRSVVCVGPDECTEVISLVGAVFGLPFVRRFIPVPPADPFAAIGVLLKNIAKDFLAAKTVQEKHSLQTLCYNLLSGVDKNTSACLQSVPPPSPHHLSQLLHMWGDVIRHSTPLLHFKSKGANAPLNSILCSCVTTQASYKLDKALPASLNETVGQILPQVLVGVSVLPIESEPFLRRIVRTIFTNYMHRYTVSKGTVHPFVVTLTSSMPSTSYQRLRSEFLQLVSDQLTSTNKSDSLSLMKVIASLQVMLKVLESTSEGAKEWSNGVFSKVGTPLLTCLIKSTDNQINSLVVNILKLLMNGSALQSEVVTKLQQAIRSHLSFHCDRVINILRVLCPVTVTAVSDCMTTVMETIEQTEVKRGSGQDNRLRGLYKTLQQDVQKHL